ncbi:GNAT family N-acetyltransferase [Acerihabitans arboris]|uniref:GNAT family N-acetyltransferase n=1 Tax=Acerihabitans arboris TaxID=2691583 RepID=A0A845SS79_9GAMM|nr:GNAT family protein [Acerihabitans arboris]NDL65381.1 GNAT family N-acetyltransferase [Acerihabitans arboris]
MDIRNIEEADFTGICRWFTSEKELAQWGGPLPRFPLDPPQLAEMLAESAGAPPRRWLFCAGPPGAATAHAQVTFDWRNGVALLGRVAVNPEQRGQGIAVPFLTRIIELVFALPAIERLELNVYTFNQAAIHTYEKLGFIREGVRRSSVKVGQQRWDTAMYAMLRS